ncbi:MAG: cupin domain-containing protein [Actinomycetota bacterium]
MAGIDKKSFDSPDETRTLEKTALAVVNIGGESAGRMTAQPGWKWSECVKPVVGTPSCQARHVGAVFAGHLHVVHEDGSEADLTPGDAYVVEPGHDAWVVGDEPFVGFEFESKTAREYGS